MSKRNIIFSTLLLMAVTFAALSPSLSAGFTNWDDPRMLTENVKVFNLSLNSLKVMFTTTHFGMYSPLVLLSYAVEHALFGFDPHVYHATNLLLHLLNTALVFWFIYLLCGNDAVAFITALLFSIHPMHVESVAWISERKDVLSTFFFLGTLIAYLYHIQRKEIKFYYYAVTLMLLSLISKPMAVTIPFILLLCDHLQKIKIDRRNLVLKLPFFALAVLFAVITMNPAVSFHNIVREYPAHLPVIGRSVLACQHIVFYIIKLILPVKLSCCYPPPDQIHNIPQAFFYFSPLIVMALTMLAVYSLKFTKKVFFAAAFFLITVAPVSQFIPEGLVIPADRYTYVPYIGLLLLLANGAVWLYQRYDKGFLLASFSMVMIFLSVLTYQRTWVWKDSVSLWADAVKNYDNVVYAHYNLAVAYSDAKQDPNKIIHEFLRTLELDPAFADARVGIGKVYAGKKEYRRAIAEFNKALELNSGLMDAYTERGTAYDTLGEKGPALKDFDSVLKAHPTYTAWYNRGTHFLRTREYDRAISDLTMSIGMNPWYGASYINRGSAHFAKKELDDAFNDFSRATELGPDPAAAYYNMGTLLAMKKEYKAALMCMNKARSLGMKVDEKLLRQLEKETAK